MNKTWWGNKTKQNSEIVPFPNKIQSGFDPWSCSPFVKTINWNGLGYRRQNNLVYLLLLSTLTRRRLSTCSGLCSPCRPHVGLTTSFPLSLGSRLPGSEARRTMTPFASVWACIALTASDPSSFLGTPPLFLGETASLSLQPAASSGDWMTEGASPPRAPHPTWVQGRLSLGLSNWRQVGGEEVGNFSQVAFLSSSFLLVAKLWDRGRRSCW